MISEKPSQCEKCKYDKFDDLSTCWKCKNCGKNYGKTENRIISKVWIPTYEDEWFTKKTADKIESYRKDSDIKKVIDRKNKKSYTVRFSDKDGSEEILTERDLELNRQIKESEEDIKARRVKKINSVKDIL